jgi:Zn-finger nucleic acid-binding protein
MNCRNCGGAMDLFATRGYFFCRYCGSFHFPETAGHDGVRVLAETAPPLPCPACEHPLAHAMLDESFHVRYCRNCRGALMKRTSFAAVVEKRRAWASDQPAPPVPLNRGELERKASCPACSTRMETHPYYGPGNVVIDSCLQCELIWLDFGELRQIVAAPGRDRGRREQVSRETVDIRTGPGVTGVGTTYDSTDFLDFVARLISS